MDIIAEHKVFEGRQLVIKHKSEACKCDMTFAVYLPPQAQKGKVPVLWWLSGLTCTHENGMIKGGLQAYAAKHGLAIIYPDTSPRGENVANDDHFAMGQGAGFYVDATQAPWAEHFQMYTYIVDELPAVVATGIPELDMTRQSISGHSMGGHGAMTIGMKNPDRYKSISAFSPMASTSTATEWGHKQFEAYLGGSEADWEAHDASILVDSYDREILVEQGLKDEWWELLQPEKLQNKANVTMRLREGYDHSYFFVTTFAEEHFAWHAKHLS